MILITGGGGFIGLNLARDLVDRGQEVLLVRRHSFQAPSFLTPYMDKQVKIALGDIGELPFLYRIIKEYQVDSIIHAASLHERTGTLYKTLKSNLDGTTEILEAARIFSLRRVTFLSSVAVYMTPRSMETLREENDLPLESPGYIAATKKAGEQICRLYAREYKLSIPMVRPPMVWGPMYHSGLQQQHAMVENAVAGKPTDLSQVYGERKLIYVYVRDCAKAISLVHLAPSLKHDVYNISDGESRTLADFAKAIREVIPSAQIKLGTTRSDKDSDLPPMSIERIKEDVGFTPDYDLKRGVKAYIDWIRDGKYN
jgi:UDP-glucose 4-epimerase